jgi:ATP-dependent RNA helicase RhlE
MSFRNLGLSPNLLKVVEDAGYTTPTPVQLAAIPPVLEGRDVIAIAQTGTGKTAAFVLPLVERLAKERSHTGRKPRVLVLAPTRELAAQIGEHVKMFSRGQHLRSVTIFGGVGESPQISELRRGVDLIIATPGRLLDLMQQRHAALDEVRFVVLDEADRMLDMGFLPQIRRVVHALPKDRQTLLFSATLSKEIEQITHEFLRNPQLVEVGRRSTPVDTVAQYLYPVPKSRKLDLLLTLLNDEKLDSVLVFSRTKHGADKIARKLNASGITTGTLHSNRSQNQRIAALKAFKDGTCRVLVATDIAARGIDVEGISHVINFDFPMAPEDYVHRIGRTGRAQAIGDALSFVTGEDEQYVRLLERMIKKAVERRKVAGFDYSEREILSTGIGTRPARSFNGEAPRHHPRKPVQRDTRGGGPRSASGSRPSSRPGSPSRSTGGRPGSPNTASQPRSERRFR